MPHGHPDASAQRERAYVTRALGGLALSLALTNAALLWPSPRTPAAPLPLPPPPEMVAMVPIEQTTQQTPAVFPTAPPPPDDLPPEEVPDDRIIEEVLRDVPLAPLPPVDGPPVPRPGAPSALPPPPLPGAPPPAPPGPSASSNRLVEQPEQSPRVQRQVFPAYPDAARREGLRARVRVRVVVSEGGQVTEAQIVERVVVQARDREEAVSSLPYGMDAAALEAARRHLFRPARDGGERVRAYAFLTLSFDPPRGG
jgi:TonB family protein